MSTRGQGMGFIKIKGLQSSVHEGLSIHHSDARKVGQHPSRRWRASRLDRGRLVGAVYGVAAGSEIGQSGATLR